MDLWEQKHFRDLDIWKNGLSLLVEIYKISSQFPKTEMFGLCDQMKRALNSVIANIAESQGRFTFPEKIRVLYQVRGEIFEVRSHLSMVYELEYINKVTFDKLDDGYEVSAKQTSSFISYLEKRKSI